MTLIVRVPTSVAVKAAEVIAAHERPQAEFDRLYIEAMVELARTQWQLDHARIVRGGSAKDYERSLAERRNVEQAHAAAYRDVRVLERVGELKGWPLVNMKEWAARKMGLRPGERPV